MSAQTIINVLHLSDLHYDRKKVIQYNQRLLLDALLRDIEKMCSRSLKPDIIVFSGDLVQDGDNGSDNYYYLYDDFLDQLIKVSRCGENRVFFCAGNHDAQRSATKKFHEHQQALQRRLCSRDALNESYLSGELGALVQDKFGNFIEFDEYFRREQPKVNDGIVRVEQADGLPVDIVSLNTSLMTWCGMEEFGTDEKRLLFPEAALTNAARECNPDHVQVFVSHHPAGWLVEFAEIDFLNSLNSRSDRACLHLHGHLHEPKPQQVSSLRGRCLASQAGALYCGRERYNGYSIITFDASQPHPVVTLRSWSDRLREFCAAAELAPELGIFFPTPESRRFWHHVEQRVDRAVLKSWVEQALEPAARTAFDASVVERSLSTIFVEPPMFRKCMVAKADDEALPEAYEEATSLQGLVGSTANVLLCGPQEFGRTTLLQQIALQLMKRPSSDEEFLTVPILVDFASIRPGDQPVHRALRSALPVELPHSCSVASLINEGLLTILVDDVDFSDVRRMRMLLDFVDSNSKNRFFFTSLQHDSVSGPAALGDAVVLKTGANVSFDQIFLKPFTRRKMRNLVKKWGQEANLDEEEILNRLVREMAAMHIPPTAINGAILLTIYESQPGFVPINRATMIDRFLEHILEKRSLKEALRGTFDYTNKHHLLSHLAGYMAINDGYALPEGELVGVLRQYLDRIGLAEDAYAILRNFLEARVLTERADGSICFRYRAFLEYFIASQMDISPDFRSWVLDDSRYLSFVNELNYYAGLERSDAELLAVIGDRFQKLTEVFFGELEWEPDLNMIDRFEPPAAGADVDLFDEIEEQLAGPSLSAEERDEILDTELPRDVENRQEVYRPAFKDSGQRWATCLLIYSGLVKNLELIPDELKRQHLSRVLRGWAYLTANTIYLVPLIAKHRRCRINGVLYDVRAPHHWSDADVARMLFLETPNTVSNLMFHRLGTEKLQRQLLEPGLGEANESLIVTFYRYALICDLRLPGWVNIFEKFIASNRKARYILESVLRKVSNIYFIGGHNQEIETSLKGMAGELLGNLRGRGKKERQRIASRVFQKINRRALVRRLEISARDHSDESADS